MFQQMVGGRSSLQCLMYLLRTPSGQKHMFRLFSNHLQGPPPSFFVTVLRPPATDRIRACQFQDFSPCLSRFYSSQQFLTSLTDQIQDGSLPLTEFPKKLEDLLDKVYLEFSSVPWIHYHNQPIALMQLLINEKVDEFMAPIQDQPHFHLLLEYLENNLPFISDELIPRCLYCMLFLGVDKTSSLIHKMIFRLHETRFVMDMKNIATITECLRIFPRGDFKIWAKISDWNVTNIENEEYRASVDVHDLSRTIINMRQLSSSQRLHSAVMLTKEIVDREQESLSMLQLGSVLRLYRHLAFHIPVENREDIMKHVQQVINLVIEKLPNFECHNFADICHMLKVMNFYPQKLMHKFQERALEIFDSRTVKVSELVNLCYVFDKNISLGTRHKVESALFQNMHQADILLISNIADVLTDIDCTNNDLIRRYQETVLENIDGIQKYITRFYKVFRFLNRCRIMDSEMESAYYNEVIKLLNSQQGLSVWTICTLTSFLLPISKPVIPNVLLDKLLRIIPQCEINNLALILFGLNRMKKPWIRQMYSQVLQLQTALHQNLNTQLHKVTAIDPLIQMIQVLYLKSERRELVLLDNIMETLGTLTHTLSMRHFRNIVSLFSQLRYCSPQIMNDLTKFTLNNHEDINFQDFSNFIRVMSFIGFQPDSFEDFQDVCIKMLDKHIMETSLPKQLRFTLDLCQMQIYPDHWLSSIFTLKYIEMIDNHIETNKESRNILQRILMMLNRNTVLDCPHLDIPWFHEDYCQKNIVAVKGNPSWMHNEVHSALQEVVGGENFFQSFVYTPYYFLLDYEVILDQAKKAINPTIANIVKPQDVGYQRVAILVLQENRFSLNSRHLLGPTQVLVRHIEILGYKTVMIPYYEWNSMALTEWAEKVKYLQKKIFS